MKNPCSLFLISLYCSIIISSCVSTNIMTLSVTNPALVDIANEVKSVGIVNRSMPSQKNSKLSKIDDILTIEGKNLDKEGAERAIEALKTELSFNKQFDKVEMLDSVSLTSNGLGQFPASLSWETVSKLCKENGVDILYVLEFFDTDSKPTYSSQEKSSVNALGVRIPIIEHTVSIGTTLKIGWRIYDPVNKIVNDEYMGTKKVISTGKGITPLAAVKAVEGRKQAVASASNSFGFYYAQRILPVSSRVSRRYYVRGAENFKIAKRKAQAGDWKGAAELWKKETLNKRDKPASRGNYNMAIYKEIEGDLDGAIKYASKAYTQYNDKKALPYINILKERKRKMEVLNKQ